jgi:hypothetical protein
LYQAENAGFYPPEMALLKGKKVLFKVEKSESASVMYDGSFRVKRVCLDPTIFAEFVMKSEGSLAEKVWYRKFYVCCCYWQICYNVLVWLRLTI